MSHFTFRTGERSGYHSIHVQLGPEPAADDPPVARASASEQVGWLRVLVDQANQGDKTVRMFVDGINRYVELLAVARKLVEGFSPAVDDVTDEFAVLIDDLARVVDKFEPPTEYVYDQDAEPHEASDD